MDHSPLTKSPSPQGPRSRWTQLLLGLVFGIAFGFLLQKGGAAKYHILVGVLLLEDWTVLQIMLTAVAVGMVGVYTLAHFGRIELAPKPTRYAANIVGGLLFGVGFALSAYCPGTSAAALGQGNFDALAVIVGMIAGSWIYAESSAWMDRHVEKLGVRGKLTVPDLFPRFQFAIVLGAAASAAAAAGVFYWLPTL